MSFISPMSCPQASFDELIAQSLSHLQQVHQHQVHLGISNSHDFLSCHHIPKLASESVDEFLAYYRHEKKSIREFFACLEDTSVASVRNDCDPWIQEIGTISSDSASEIDEYTRSNPRACNEAETNDSTTNNRKCSHGRMAKDSCLAEGVGKSPLCKRKRRKLTASEKEERRRNQNREAQRRFRERHMLSSCRDVSGRSMRK